MSETAKHRHLVIAVCQGNGVDLGSGGDPVVPHAIQVELPTGPYSGAEPVVPIQWRGDVRNLPFQDGTLDFVHASHVLEDFTDWGPVIAEWDRVLKPGGHMIIAVPDHHRFRALVARNAEHGIDTDNLAHKHESYPGEVREFLAAAHGYGCLYDGFVSESPEEYSLLTIARKGFAA